MNIHHVGYVVNNIEKSLTYFYSIGYALEGEQVIDEKRQIKICFVKNQSYRLELIESMSDESAVYNMLKKNGACPYHICYQCDNIDEMILSLKSEGWILMQKPSEAIAIEEKKVAFLYHCEVGLIELLEG